MLALGGNALGRPEQEGTYEEQAANVKLACAQVVKLLKKGHNLVLTHGNGPQVGALAIQSAATREVPEQPLHVLGAMTQGEIGYLIQRELGNQLRAASLKRPVVALVTQVVVNRDDPAFQNPSKPIGPFYDETTAKRLATERGFVVKKVLPKGERQFRRAVPSPDPVRIVEAELIAGLVETGAVVISSGGGGIPVVSDGSGQLVGVDAVIDKDLGAERLAEAVSADALLVLTNIEKVKLNFGKSDEKDLDKLSVREAERYLAEGQFGSGSMGPKVLACIRFLKWGGKVGVISSLEKATEALDGTAGTRFVPD
ncbi:MAG: carbamate kinase [Nitrososphaerales archaeon]|nr:carbamate kinase [Nitrososphaerales archaeon]